MIRPSGTRTVSLQNAKSKAVSDGKLIVGKHGVYLVRGHANLNTLQLVPWEQLLCPLPPARRETLDQNIL